jgi:Zn finger protein HypA/HybF involved in hydrogenase expression
MTVAADYECQSCGEVFTETDAPDACVECDGDDLVRVQEYKEWHMVAKAMDPESAPAN